MADGCPTATLQATNHLCRTGCILCLDGLQRGMIGQELPTLHECHGMGVHLGDGFPRVFGQTADAMLDVELMLAHDGCAGVAQQLVVAEQRSRNGILDGSHANDRRVTLDLLVDLLEGGTADNLYLLVLEILMGRDVVERPQFALYCYPFHIVFDAPAARFNLIINYQLSTIN